MDRILTLEIGGFRGSKSPIFFQFDPQVNFFIGRNGTGKTTLMNLLNYVLQGDFVALGRADFEYLNVKLISTNNRSRPQIKVNKEFEPDGDLIIVYRIFIRSKDKGEIFRIKLSDLQSPWRLRDSKNWPLRLFGRSEFSDSSSAIQNSLKKLIGVSWISVHRGSMGVPDGGKLGVPDEGDRKFSTPVDRKLYQVSRDFGAYFSTLDKAAADESDKFQQSYFLSLISPPLVNSIENVSNINIDEETSSIEGMFKEFNFDSIVYRKKLDIFSQKLRTSLSNYMSNPKGPISGDQFLVLTDAVRIHSAVGDWHSLIKRREIIYAPKNNFVQIVNELFYKKKLEIDSGNSPIFINEEGVIISIDDLSTGEKQMFIILSEALLQKHSTCIFLADEPELSLHIEWQERLVPNLRRINPNAQIIFATHSPDIVGAYGSKAINLEHRT